MLKKFRNFLSKRKQFFCGLTAGLASAVGFALWQGSGGEPFENMPYVVREVKNDTLVHTPNFDILYRGVTGVNSAGG